MKTLFKYILLLIFILQGTNAFASSSPYFEYLPSANEQVYQKSTYRYSAMDPTLKNNLPGCGYPVCAELINL